MIKVKDLCKSYDDNKIFEHINLDIDSKGIDIVIGINGSGKTTLLNCICNLTKVTEGDIWVDGIDYKEKEAKKKMCYITSDFYLPEYLSGKEYAKFIFGIYKDYNEEVFEKCIDLFDLECHLGKKVSEYSYGMKKKLLLSIGLALNVKYVFADELFNGLDFESFLMTDYLIKIFSKNRKFVLVSHNLDYIKKNSDAKIYLLNAGKMEVIDDFENIETIVIRESELNKKYEDIKRFFSNF